MRHAIHVVVPVEANVEGCEHEPIGMAADLQPGNARNRIFDSKDAEDPENLAGGQFALESGVVVARHAAIIEDQASGKPLQRRGTQYMERRRRAAVLPQVGIGAAAELGASSGAEDELATPANSNTAPRRRADTSDAAPAARIEAESSRHVEVAETPALEPIAPRPDRVDVVLKRETATVSLPLDTANDHGGLIGRLTDALTAIDEHRFRVERRAALARPPKQGARGGGGPGVFGVFGGGQDLAETRRGPVGEDRGAGGAPRPPG